MPNPIDVMSVAELRDAVEVLEAVREGLQEELLNVTTLLRLERKTYSESRDHALKMQRLRYEATIENMKAGARHWEACYNEAARAANQKQDMVEQLQSLIHLPRPAQ